MLGRGWLPGLRICSHISINGILARNRAHLKGYVGSGLTPSPIGRVAMTLYWTPLNDWQTSHCAHGYFGLPSTTGKRVGWFAPKKLWNVSKDFAIRESRSTTNGRFRGCAKTVGDGTRC